MQMMIKDLAVSRSPAIFLPLNLLMKFQIDFMNAKNPRCQNANGLSIVNRRRLTYINAIDSHRTNNSIGLSTHADV